MASDWESIALHDVATLRNGAGVKQVFFTEELDGVPLIKVSNFTDDSISIEGLTKVDSTHAQQWESHFIETGDVLVATVGSWPPNWSSVVGKVVKAPIESSGAIQNQNTCCIQPSKIVDKKFLYYKLKNREFLLWVSNVAQGSANQARIPVKQLGKYNFKLPPLSEQKAIANILGSLDDKIELNRQMNETLEAMAQTLFKSWFVDFDPVIDNALAAGNAIPDEFIERAEQRKGIEKKDNLEIQGLFPDEFEFTEEMGWIPKGWEVTPLAALIKLTGGGTPKTSVEEYWNGDIPWFSVVDAPSQSDIFVIDTEKHVTSLGVEKSSTKILPIGTTIISARGTVGKCAMVSRPMAMNQSCYGVSGKEGISNTFVYYSVFLSVSELQSKGHGSVFNTITGDTFKSINLAFSGGRLTREFDDLVNPYFERILAKSLQAKTLSKLRDTLLPKLMSGELRVDNL